MDIDRVNTVTVTFEAEEFLLICDAVRLASDVWQDRSRVPMRVVGPGRNDAWRSALRMHRDLISKTDA